MDEPPNHPFKAVFHVAILACGLVVLVRGAVVGDWALVVVGAGVAGVAVVGLAFIVKGRNPWWLQGPLDRRVARRRGVEVPDTLPRAREAAGYAVVVFALVLLTNLVVPWSIAPVIAALTFGGAVLVRQRRRRTSR
ncbi:MAG TPA: hypothetical protein VI318_12320 [Baekduia sp.]